MVTCCLFFFIFVYVIHVFGESEFETQLQINCANITRKSIFGNNLCGKLVFKGGSDEYCDSRLQYAYEFASYNTDFNVNIYPSIILYAQCNNDISLTLSYASYCNFKVVIRSGGHQYSGLSSCNSMKHDCIQIDMSYYRGISLHRDNINMVTMVRAEVGVNIGLFATFLDNHNYFLPTGECNSVHLGGHVQTGGYGHIGRIFGTLLDYVYGFHIIYANGTEEYVTNQTNADIHWSIGGNPGSFGIITYYDFIPLKNSDHPHSSAIKCYWYYDDNTVYKLLLLFHKLMSNSVSGFDFNLNWNLALRVISMYRDYIQLLGAFGDIDGVTEFNNTLWNIIENIGKPIHCEKYINYPFSYITRFVLSMNVTREYALPYVKRTRVSRTKWDINFIKILTERVNRMIISEKKQGLFLSLQIALTTPYNNALYLYDPFNIKTSIPHRDMTSFLTTDIFYYDSLNKNAKQLAIEWHNKNTELLITNKLFDTNGDDIRMSWSSFGDLNISNVYKYYYNNLTVYNKLREIKTKYDKYNILSNDFTLKPLNYTHTSKHYTSIPDIYNDKCDIVPNHCQCGKIKHIQSVYHNHNLYCSKLKIFRNKCNIDGDIESFIIGNPHYYCPIDLNELNNTIVSIKNFNDNNKLIKWNIYNDSKIFGIQINNIKLNELNSPFYFEICYSDIITLISGTSVYYINDQYYSCYNIKQIIPYFCQLNDVKIIGGPKMKRVYFNDDNIHNIHNNNIIYFNNNLIYSSISTIYKILAGLIIIIIILITLIIRFRKYCCNCCSFCTICTIYFKHQLNNYKTNTN